MCSLVTGGAGFIGSRLVEYLIQFEQKIIVLDDFSSKTNEKFIRKLNSDRIEIIEGSVLNQKLVSNIMSGVSHCYHLAATLGVQRINSDPIVALENNIKGSEVVLTQAAKFGVRTIVASTSEIYGKNINVPLSEHSDRILGQTNIARWTYSEAKAINEFYALELYNKHKFPMSIVRFFNTVGPRQSGTYGMVMPRFIESAITNKPIYVYGDGEQTRSFCSVSDAVIALKLIIDKPESIGEVYNLGSDYEISILDLAKLIIKLTNSKSEIIHVSHSEIFGVNFEEPRRRVPDISKIKGTIDWAPIKEVSTIVLEIAQHYKTKDLY